MNSPIQGYSILYDKDGQEILTSDKLKPKNASLLEKWLKWTIDYQKCCILFFCWLSNCLTDLMFSALMVFFSKWSTNIPAEKTQSEFKAFNKWVTETTMWWLLWWVLNASTSYIIHIHTITEPLKTHVNAYKQGNVFFPCNCFFIYKFKV